MSGAALRRCSTTELGPLVGRLDEWLRAEQDWSLVDEFPQVFGAASRARHHLIEVDGELVAHAATLELEMLVRGKPWRPRLVGSVVVDPERRGQGLGLRVMEDVVQDFERRRCDALVLWSDKPGFYAKLGFAPFGEELHLGVAPGEEAELRGELRAPKARDLEELLLLHLGKGVHSRRELSDMESYLRVPGCEFWVLERDGHVVAYCVIGKGLDFPEFVHEFAGNERDLQAMFRTLATQRKETLGVLVPLWRSELLQHFPKAQSCRNPLALGIVERAPVDAAFDGFDSI